MQAAPATGYSFIGKTIVVDHESNGDSNRGHRAVLAGRAATASATAVFFPGTERDAHSSDVTTTRSSRVPSVLFDHHEQWERHDEID
jgi:hypothetical protein